MKQSAIRIELPLEAVTTSAMPANCEVLARAYVGDLQFGLARDPKNRGLYLLSLDGYWYLDTQRLVSAFAEALRDLDRELALARGASLTGLVEVPPAAPLYPRRGVFGARAPAAERAASGRGKRKAG